MFFFFSVRLPKLAHLHRFTAKPSRRMCAEASTVYTVHLHRYSVYHVCLLYRHYDMDTV